MSSDSSSNSKLRIVVMSNEEIGLKDLKLGEIANLLRDTSDEQKAAFRRGEAILLPTGEHVYYIQK